MRTKCFLIGLTLLSYIPIHASVNSIRWGSNGDPLTGLTITWSNSSSKDSIKWGYTTSLEQGSCIAVARSGNGGGNFLKYTFPVVTPSSAIYYKLFDSSNNSWGPQKTFRTAPPASTTSFTFLGMGDSRSGMNIWGQISALANSQQADFTIFNGDIVANGGSNSDWTSWFNSGSQFIENNLIYHSMGNHDAMSVGNYQNTFELPKANGTNLYYSFTYGNAVFICLNSESPSDAAQLAWLKTTLQANQDKKWKVVFFHKPFYTIGTHAGEMNSHYGTWWKAFDDYGVDIVCNGHDHMYERTKPINRNVSTSAPVASYGSGPLDGRCQIVCGGAGAPLYSGSANWFIQKYQSKYNFCKFEVNDCAVTCTVYDNNSTVIETFSLDKCATGVSDVSERFNKMTLAPNPAKDVFKLIYQSADMGEGTVKVYDLTGKLVLSENINKTGDEFTADFHLPTLPAGAYAVEIMVGNKRDNALLVIE